MRLLVAYDVSTLTQADRRRLLQVARICCGYGVRVQRSVFECVLTDTQRVEFVAALVRAIDPEIDSLRIYPLRGPEEDRVFGLARPSLDDLLIV